MSKINKHSQTLSLWEKLLSPFAFLTGNPTRPHKVPYMATEPTGLVLIHSALNPAEADLLRQVLQNEGIRVEYVPPVTTGVFGTTGSPYIYVPADQETEARNFLREYFDDGNESDPSDT